METKTPIFTKVFIIGLLQLIMTTVLEIVQGGDTMTPYAIAFSAVIAILTFFGRNLRGQAASIVATVASSLVNYFNLHSTPEFDFKEIAIQVLTLAATIIGIFNTSPPKTIGYESAPAIRKAKEQGEELTNGGAE